LPGAGGAPPPPRRRNAGALIVVGESDGLEGGQQGVADSLLRSPAVAQNSFDRLLDTLRRQREDLERQMDDTTKSQTRTSDLMKTIEELRERVKRTSAPAEKEDHR
jgi:hypothetical protein